MKAKQILMVLVAAALTSGVVAQGFPGGGQGGRGGGRGMMGMMGGGGLQPAAFLLMREDVQEDLKITDDQKTKLGEAQQSMQQEMMSTFQNMRNNGGGGGDREAMMAEMRKVMEKMQAGATKRVNEILDATQQKRIKEISVQLAGNQAVMDKDVAKEIAITDAQKSAMDALKSKMDAANRGLMEKARGGEIEWTQVGEITQKNTKALNDEIGKLLTEQQKSKLKTMGGAPFKEKKPEGAGG